LPLFRVRVVASYPPTKRVHRKDTLVYRGERLVQPGEVKERLGEWVEAAPGRKLSISHAVDPPLLTVEVIYDRVDAPSEWEAEVDGKSMFDEQSAADALPEPETVVPHAEEL
jgi:hypothetical protein